MTLLTEPSEIDAMAAWEIVPIRLGRMTVDTSQLLRGRRLGEKIEIPCIA